MNRQRKGSGRELRTAHILESEGWTVGSRRHTAGAGDLLACKAGEANRLLEVKGTAAGPYTHFGPTARAAMLAEAERMGGVAELAWWPRRARTHEIIGAADWPPDGLSVR